MEALYVRIGRFPVLPQQRDHGHDLKALAVAAVNDVVVDPRLLHDVADGVALHGLDCDHGAVADVLQTSSAHGARGHRPVATVQVLHELMLHPGSGHSEVIAKHPEQREWSGWPSRWRRGC